MAWKPAPASRTHHHLPQICGYPLEKKSCVANWKIIHAHRKTWVNHGVLYSFMSFISFLIVKYPLVICYIAIENDPVEIVDFPIEHGDFP